MAGKARIARRRGIEGGEGGGPGLAEQDGAGAAQAADHGGVESSLAACVERRAILGGQSAGLEDILDAERNAVEQSFGEGSLRRDFHPGVDLGFAGGDAAQTNFQQAASGLLTGVQSAQEFEEHYRYQPSLQPARGAGTPACRVETRLDTGCGCDTVSNQERPQEWRRGRQECPRHVICG